MRANLKEGEVRPVKKDPGKVQAVRARQRALGRELRRMYDEVVREPIPDEFLDLLRQIDKSNGTDSAKGEPR
ncbi:MAG: NepR family anti-sigma factor [Alphaproteobacteria bacterium]